MTVENKVMFYLRQTLILGLGRWLFRVTHCKQERLGAPGAVYHRGRPGSLES